MKKTLIFVGVVIGTIIISISTIHILGRLLVTLIATAIVLGAISLYIKKTYNDWFLHPPYHQRYRDLE